MGRFLRGLAIFIVGTVFGVVLTVFFYPYVFPPPAANEQLADADARGGDSIGEAGAAGEAA